MSQKPIRNQIISRLAEHGRAIVDAYWRATPKQRTQLLAACRTRTSTNCEAGQFYVAQLLLKKYGNEQSD